MNFNSIRSMTTHIHSVRGYVSVRSRSDVPNFKLANFIWIQIKSKYTWHLDCQIKIVEKLTSSNNKIDSARQAKLSKIRSKYV